MMQKRAAILMTMALMAFWVTMHVDTMQGASVASDGQHAAFCSAATDEPMPVSYSDLMALMPDMPCEHHQMQNDTSISTSRTSSLRDHRRCIRMLCLYFTHASHDRFQVAFEVTKTMKAIGHRWHHVLLADCCMRC